MLSKVLIKENVKGNIINLRIWNYTTGPQGTLNAILNRKPRDKPKEFKEVELVLTIANIILRVKILAFTPLTNVLAFNEEDMFNYKPLKSHIKSIN